MSGRPAWGTLPSHARAVLCYMRSQPRTGWFISDLLPGSSGGFPLNYPPDRRSLNRSLDTLVARGLASRVRMGSVSHGRIHAVPGRNPTYVYFLPGSPPGKVGALQVWLAADPVSADQTYNMRHGLPKKRDTPASVVEYLEVELVTPEGRGPVSSRALTALLRATFLPITQALETLHQPALLVARISQTNLRTRGPGSGRVRKPPVPPGLMRAARAAILTPLGMDPKRIRAAKGYG